MKKSKQQGLSLVELMVSLTLGLLVIAAVIYLFLSSKQTYIHTDRMVRMNENGRYALGILSEDLRLVDFWGEARTLDIQTDSNLDDVAIDCSGVGQGYDFATPFGAGTAVTASILDCIDDAVIGSDFLVVKHVATSPTAVGTISGDRTYIASNVAKAILFDGDGKDPRPTTTPGGDVPNGQFWEYNATIYYVRNDGSGVPSLQRRRLTGNTWGDPEEVAIGVEQLRVLVGVDTNNDGNTDAFVGSNAVTDWTQAVAARIYLLVRTEERDPYYTDIRQYLLGDNPIGPMNDNFHRVLFNTSVALRNRRLSIAGGLE